MDMEGTRKVIAQEIHDLGTLKAVYREVPAHLFAESQHGS